jgi:hypothetical protein
MTVAGSGVILCAEVGGGGSDDDGEDNGEVNFGTDPPVYQTF